jgi:hypothetical protein
VGINGRPPQIASSGQPTSHGPIKPLSYRWLYRLPMAEWRIGRAKFQCVPCVVQARLEVTDVELTPRVRVGIAGRRHLAFERRQHLLKRPEPLRLRKNRPQALGNFMLVRVQLRLGRLRGGIGLFAIARAVFARATRSALRVALRLFGLRQRPYSVAHRNSSPALEFLAIRVNRHVDLRCAHGEGQALFDIPMKIALFHFCFVLCQQFAQTHRLVHTGTESIGILLEGFVQGDFFVPARRDEGLSLVSLPCCSSGVTLRRWSEAQPDDGRTL